MAGLASVAAIAALLGGALVLGQLGTANAEGAVSAEQDKSEAMAAYEKAIPRQSGSCLTCHTDAQKLQEALEDPNDDVSKYLVDEDFATSLHGALGCSYCHGGYPEKEDASQAMLGMIERPSYDGGSSVCGTCHTSIVETYADSLHNTAKGIEMGWTNRLADAGETLGANIGEQFFYHDDFQGACVDCHASCGTCHVRGAEDPTNTDTGLIDGHRFVTAENNEEVENTCMACHAPTITDAFNNHDIHGPSGANMTCMDCHNLAEVHGDGTTYTTMKHSGAITTSCEDCHDPDSLEGEWHDAAHTDSVECWACHSSTYLTCANCHGTFAADHGNTPIQINDDCFLGYDLVNGKVTTLLKAPISTGLLGDATDLQLNEEDLNNHSTWYNGQPHSVILPEVTQEFCDRCHGEGTDLLTEDDLQFPDYEEQQIVKDLPEVNVEDYIEK